MMISWERTQFYIKSDVPDKYVIDLLNLGIKCSADKNIFALKIRSLFKPKKILRK